MTGPAKTVVFAGLVALALIAMVPGARAEQAYVIEQLVVGVVSEPGGAGERIGQVKSGDRLEVLERQGDEAHVRLANGKDGWIKGSYLSTDEPLQVRLSERTAEVDKLKQDIVRLESELASAHAARAPLATPATTAPAPAPAAEINTSPGSTPLSDSQPAASAPPNDALFLRSPEAAGELPWEWVLGTAAVMLLVGFVIGWRTLDRRIRRKYGGLKIY